MKKKKQTIPSLDQLISGTKSDSVRFHTSTKIHTIEHTHPDQAPDSWKTIQFKGYGRAPEIPLPTPILSNISLKHTLMTRESCRNFGSQEITIDAISTILYFAGGVMPKTTSHRRFYPSAGARYPLEMYVIALHSDLQKGVYHYYLKSHALEQLTEGINSDLRDIFIQNWTLSASCIIVITGVFNRTVGKYGERGYRYALIESGHIAQNISLVCAAMELNCCAIGGFHDRKLEELIDIDGSSESVVYAVAIGSKK